MKIIEENVGETAAHSEISDKSRGLWRCGGFIYDKNQTKVANEA